MHFQHSFGMIIHNGASFVRQAIESIYDVAHEIIIIEGSEPAAYFMATVDGLSVDLTKAAILSTPDPQHKITYIQGGKYKSKNDECNEYMKRVTGDYIWQLDSDELYHPEDVIEIDRLLFTHKYELVKMPFLHFWRNTFQIARGTSWERPWPRIFKFEPGDRYAGHRPPQIVRKKWEQMKLLDAEILRQKGIFCYHYGFVDNQRTKWKVVYHCNRGLKFQDYFLTHWIGNTARHYNNINQPENTIEEFKGNLPAPILKGMWGNHHKISILHVLPNWGPGGGCTEIRDLIYSSNLGYFNHGLYISKSFYHGESPLIKSIPFYTENFKEVAKKYDIVEFSFWRSMPELTEILSMVHRPKVIIIIPIYNDNALRVYDRFYLNSKEIQLADHVVFVTNKALNLPGNKGIVNKSVVPLGPEVIWAASYGYHWRTNQKKVVGYIGPINPAVTHSQLPEILKDVSHTAIIEIAGGGSMTKQFQSRVSQGQQYKWLGRLKKKDLYSVLSKWDVYVYPMKEHCYCGAELKIQDACASSIPMVLKPSTGLCDMGLEKCSIICKNYEDVAPAVNKLLSDQAYRRSMQHAARVHALQTLGSHTAARDMEVIYQSLM